MATALHITTEGTLCKVDPDSLDDYQSLVGGYIEYLHITDGVAAYVNEEGLLDNLEPNLKATRMVSKLMGEHGPAWLSFNGPLRGDVVLIGNADANGDTLDLDPQFIAGALGA